MRFHHPITLKPLSVLIITFCTPSFHSVKIYKLSDEERVSEIHIITLDSSTQTIEFTDTGLAHSTNYSYHVSLLTYDHLMRQQLLENVTLPFFCSGKFSKTHVILNTYLLAISTLCDVE